MLITNIIIYAFAYLSIVFISKFIKKRYIIKIMNKQTESLVDRIDLLLKQRNEKRAFLAEVIGITAMSFSDWKRRGTIPAGDICVKIANYFNVSVEWLITGEEPKADSGPKPSNEDNEITKLFNDLQSLPSPQKQVITAIIQSSISQIKSSLA